MRRSRLAGLLLPLLAFVPGAAWAVDDDAHTAAAACPRVAAQPAVLRGGRLELVRLVAAGRADDLWEITGVTRAGGAARWVAGLNGDDVFLGIDGAGLYTIEYASGDGCSGAAVVRVSSAPSVRTS